jgi:hypothetical protein
MDNLFEILVPVIFAAIYFFGNMLSGKSEDESAPGKPQGAPRRGEDPEAIERQRRIQEEIRRKIMERRNATEESASESAPERRAAARALQERRAAAGQRRLSQERHRHRESAPDLESRIPHPGTRIPHPGTRIPEPASRTPEPDTYGSQMEAQLRQIEATKRQAEKLQKQAKVRTREISDRIGRPKPSATIAASRRPRFAGSVRSTLRDPAAARTAFIYGEVLGPPVSQQKASTVPGLLR